MGDGDKPQAHSDPQKKNKRIASAAHVAVELAPVGHQPSNTTTGSLPPAGFHYDSSTGYYYRPHPTPHGSTTTTTTTTNNNNNNNNHLVYYDAATNMYYHQILHEWGYINYNIQDCIGGSSSGTREFVSFSGQREWLGEEEEEEEEEGGKEEKEKEGEEMKQQQQGKRGSVIGAGPKLNAEGLLEAARQEDLKIQERREKRKRVVGIVHKGSGWAARRKEERALA